MLWEYIAVGIIVAAALAVVARKAYRSLTGRSCCGCKSQCPAGTTPRPEGAGKGADPHQREA